MHKRVLGCPFLIFVIFLLWGGFFEVYAMEGNEWLRTPYTISVFVILPLAGYIAVRLSLAKDEEIQTLNLKGPANDEKEKTVANLSSRVKQQEEWVLKYVLRRRRTKQ